MKRKGFSLIELMVVIAIIGLLAGMSFPAFSYFQEKGRRTTCQNNLKQIYIAVRAYSNQAWGNRFPCPQPGAATLGWGAVSAFADKMVWNNLQQNSSVLVCPGDKSIMATEPAYADLNSANGYKHTSYTFAFGLHPGATLKNRSASDIALISDDDGGVANALLTVYRGGRDGSAHSDDGGNAVFLEGSARWVSGAGGVIEKMYNDTAWNGTTGNGLVN